MRHQRTMWLIVILVLAAGPRITQASHCAAGLIHDPAGGNGCVPAASTGSDPNAVVLPNPLPASDIPTILGTVMRAGFGVLGSLALLMFTYGGFLWLTSGGNPEMVEKGKQTMVWAILGVAVIFAGYAIVQFTLSVLTR